jgi:hypothetical protein
MESDLIEKITFSENNGEESELIFSYLQDIDNVGHEFIPPRAKSYRGSRRNSPGMLWLVHLVKGRK